MAVALVMAAGQGDEGLRGMAGGAGLALAQGAGAARCCISLLPEYGPPSRPSAPIGAHIHAGPQVGEGGHRVLLGGGGHSDGLRVGGGRLRARVRAILVASRRDLQIVHTGGEEALGVLLTNQWRQRQCCSTRPPINAGQPTTGMPASISCWVASLSATERGPPRLMLTTPRQPLRFTWSITQFIPGAGGVRWQRGLKGTSWRPSSSASLGAGLWQHAGERHCRHAMHPPLCSLQALHPHLQ